MPDVRPIEMELHMPTPAPGAVWAPWTCNTHFFSFAVPEADIGAFLYIRWQPASMTSQGGVCLWQGCDALEMLDMDHHDYRVTMGWPKVELGGRKITTEQNYSIEYAEDLRSQRLTYDSRDGSASFDLLATGVTPLYKRAHVVPTELLETGHAVEPGGFEQISKLDGELVLNGERHIVDCYGWRDRSWGQLRPEDTFASPPMGLIPQYYGPDLAFSAVCIEHPDTEPSWKGIYDWPEDRSSLLYGWGVIDGEFLDMVDVRRDCSDFHPWLTCPRHQEIDVTFSNGRTVHVSGEMTAVASVFTWPNSLMRCAVYRWTAEDGRVTYDGYAEQYFDRQYAREMRRRAGIVAS
jgi:hypothetical protein